MDIRERLREGRLFADGGMGTQLQGRGLQPGETPELWNVSRPDDVRAIHAAYFAAGSDYVLTNTFGANGAKYEGGIPLAEVVAAGVARAREAADAAPGPRWVALDVGPTGRLLRPGGDFTFDDAYDAFAAEIAAGAAAGADLVAIETMGDTLELKAAVLAAKETCALPVFATVSLQDDGKLLTGADVEAVAALLEGLRVDALGLNCGLGPDRMRPFLTRLAAATRLPVIAKANAGMPREEGGRTVYDVGPDAFARQAAALAEAGADILGGCCGTTPAHIAAVVAACSAIPRAARPPRPRRGVVSSGTHAVALSTADTVVIGERINPTGKKLLRRALAEGDMAYVLREAVAEAEAGAQILDVNVGVPGLDEPAVLARVVDAVQGVTDLPLQIDTADPAALERALRRYNGKALVNSVNGKRESMEAVLPLVAKYGGVVVALTLDESGIPPTAEGRLAIARRILARGADFGLRPEDFVIDVLCLAASADATSGLTILEALRLVRSELGLPTVLGVSNISFGLPGRALVNAAFYGMALGAGLSAAIVNPLSPEMMATFRAYRALMGLDANCAEWIEAAPRLLAAGAAARPAATTASPVPAAHEASAAGGAADSPLAAAIRHGLGADAAQAARDLLAAGRTPLDVIDGDVVPALEVVGRGFEKGTVFLPQLLMAADAASAAFEILRAELRRSGDTGKSKGPIILATVKGDIHDIGKNIVRALLENYGFEVVDLGRDVAPEAVVAAARERGARLVGLSALMTTTVPAMAETIRQIRASSLDAKVVVGGAVLTQEYADKIGADYYAKDAMQTVRVAESIFSNSPTTPTPQLATGH